jgi:hypothetical protein
MKSLVESLNPWYQTIDFGNGVWSNNGKCATGTSEQVYQDIRSFLPEDSLYATNYLDIGSNAGYFLVRLLLDGGAEGNGIDSNPLCIEQSKFVSKHFLKKRSRNLKFFHQDYKDYLIQEAKNVRYDAIIASSVLYPRFLKPMMDKKWLDDHFNQITKLLVGKTHTIIARWRQENNCRNGDMFYEHLKKLNFHETGRKKLCSRTLVRYQKGGIFKLSKNHDMVFDGNRTRGWDEIISAISGCKNLRSWHYSGLHNIKRKDLSNFISYVSPDELRYRNFNKSKNMYNTTTEYDFLKCHKAKLLQSIIDNGIQTPIVAIKTNDEYDEYRVDDGNHRSGIAKALKLNKVPAIILKEIKET